VVEDLVFNLATRDRLRTALLRELENTPLILAPPCSVPAFKHRERSWTVGGKTIGLLNAMTQVTPWNLLGLPAAVIPFDVSEQGLPIGVQIIGRPWDEETILEVAVKLEEARGPFAAPPGFSN
jgi:Asp-tRNA(Asn)/Glu-tRNA(Gln) amidotransferase A subunit family amidase